MSRSKVATCVYCGERAKVTREHVIPKCLFPDPLPANMITVATCFSCNNGKSGDDVYLRDCLLADMATGDNALAQGIRLSKLKKSVQTNRSEVARSALAWAYPTTVHSPGGIYLGPAFGVPVEAKRLESMYTKMIRGLHHHVTKLYLPRHYECQIDRVSEEFALHIWSEAQLRGANAITLHPGVFACQYNLVCSDQFLSRWLLLFYGAILIRVSTLPPNGIDGLVAELGTDPATGLILQEFNDSTEANPI
jgi:hypothetical protein